MPPPYCYDYPRPSVTVDLAAFARDGDGLRVLLIRRKHEPFAGLWALPGGFLEIDEPVEAGARRELREETGLNLDGEVSFLGVWGDPGRDPRGRTISLVYVAVLPGTPPKARGGDDAAEAAWVDPWAAHGLAFDHDDILRSALRWLSRWIEAGPMALALLPEEFGEAELHSLFRAGHVPETAVKPWVDEMTRVGALEARPGLEVRYRRGRDA